VSLATGSVNDPLAPFRLERRSDLRDPATPYPQVTAESGRTGAIDDRAVFDEVLDFQRGPLSDDLHDQAFFINNDVNTRFWPSGKSNGPQLVLAAQHACSTPLRPRVPRIFLLSERRFESVLLPRGPRPLVNEVMTTLAWVSASHPLADVSASYKVDTGASSGPPFDP
jgi:hypothetical protein